ncbi:unnamed protein product [Prunus armeniaca]
MPYVFWEPLNRAERGMRLRLANGPLRRMRIVARIEVVSLRPARIVARIEVVSPRLARIAARVNLVSSRPAGMWLTVETFGKQENYRGDSAEFSVEV